MNGFCPENYLNLLKHYLYGEYINEYLTFYEASFNYTKQGGRIGPPVLLFVLGVFVCFRFHACHTLFRVNIRK